MNDYDDTLTDKEYFENTFITESELQQYTENSNNHEIDLFTAASLGQLDYLKSALKRCDINKKNTGSWTALLYAVYYNHLDLVDYLIEHGASLHTLNSKRQNVLMVAARYGSEILVQQLINAGSILETRDINDWTAVSHAVFGGNPKVLQTLLNHKANPDAYIRTTGKTPLMYAALSGNKPVVELLLQHGANPDFTLFGTIKTAAVLAHDSGFLDISKMIENWRMHEFNTKKFNSPSNINYLQNMSPKIDRMDYSNGMLNPSNSMFTSRSAPIYDLDSLLHVLSLDEYIPLFRRENIDLQIFLGLSVQDLKECGVAKVGPRLKMSSAIHRWHENAPPLQGLEAGYARKLQHDLSVERDKVKELENDLKSEKSMNHEMLSRLQTLESGLQKIRNLILAARDTLKTPIDLILSNFNNPSLVNGLTYASRFLDEACQYTNELNHFYG